MLEIARQSRPRRLRQLLLLGQAGPRSSRAHRVRTVGGRLGCRRQRDPPVRRGRGASRRPGGSATRASRTIGVCFLHSYVNAAHERAMREVLAAEHPEARSSRSPARCCASTASTNAPSPPWSTPPSSRDIRRYVANIAARLDELVARRPAIPFYVMKSNGGVLSRRGGRAPADHDRAVRAGGRRARRGRGRAGGRLRRW